MHFPHLFLVLANCFFQIFGTATNSSRYLTDNPVPTLERYFSRSLYQRLAQERRGGNLLISPLGVDLLLATLLEGARGEDREHLSHLLGLDQLDGFPYSDIKKAYQQSLKNINSLLLMATRLYISKDFEVNKKFLSIANDYYQTGAEMLNLTNKEEAAEAINSYVTKNTNHTIRKFITEGDLDQDSTMVCISTTHFQDQWALLFPKQTTSEQQFRQSPQTHSSVQMMHVKNKFHFVWNATLQAKILALDFIMFEATGSVVNPHPTGHSGIARSNKFVDQIQDAVEHYPHRSKNVSMIFILPDKDDDLFDLETSVAAIGYVSLLRMVRSTPPVNVDLWMPRFTLREDLDLGQTLEQMGLARLFTPEADLSGISSHAGLHVSKMKQKCHLVVGENGVEASSTEVVEADYGAEDTNWQEFHADHPFHFFLVMDELVVFQGRVVKP